MQRKCDEFQLWYWLEKLEIKSTLDFENNFVEKNVFANGKFWQDAIDSRKRIEMETKSKEWIKSEGPKDVGEFYCDDEKQKL